MLALGGRLQIQSCGVDGRENSILGIAFLHFLRACRGAGGVSAGAVIRLALRKLADAQAPADVATELLSGSAAQRTPGRKRL